MNENAPEAESGRLSTQARLAQLAPGFGKRVERAADTFDSVEKAATAIGLGHNQLRRIFAEQAVPSFPAIVLLARKTGYRVEWLAFNEEPEKSTVAGAPSLPPPLMQEQFVWVPELDVQAAGGHGRMNEAEYQEVKSVVPIPLNIIQSLGLDPKLLRVMEVKGVSMVPDLNDGDRAVVYVGEEPVRDGKIYSINIGDDLVVKELQLEPDGGLTLVSKNPSFAPRKISKADRSNLRIAGRVVFAIKRFL